MPFNVAFADWLRKLLHENPNKARLLASLLYKSIIQGAEVRFSAQFSGITLPAPVVSALSFGS